MGFFAMWHDKMFQTHLTHFPPQIWTQPVLQEALHLTLIKHSSTTTALVKATKELPSAKVNGQLYPHLPGPASSISHSGQSFFFLFFTWLPIQHTLLGFSPSQLAAPFQSLLLLLQLAS